MIHRYSTRSKTLGFEDRSLREGYSSALEWHASGKLEIIMPHFPSCPTILLIDDDRSVRESFGRVLASDGLQVITASGGRDALDCLSEILPTLIITDLCMGPLTGWDLILHLQNHQPNLPVFVITALPPNLTGGADRMATAYFQKPLDLDALLAAIHRSLRDPSPLQNPNPSY